MTVSSFLKQKQRTEHLALMEMYIADRMLLLGQINPISPYNALLSCKVIVWLCCLREFAHWWMNGHYGSNPGQTHLLVRILRAALMLDCSVNTMSTQNNKTSNNKLISFTGSKELVRHSSF